MDKGNLVVEDGMTPETMRLKAELRHVHYLKKRWVTKKECPWLQADCNMYIVCNSEGIEEVMFGDPWTAFVTADANQHCLVWAH